MTHETALKKYARLCAKSERELQRGHSTLLPYLRAMSCAFELFDPFPSIWRMRHLPEQDRKDILRLLGYFVSERYIHYDREREADFRREFERIGKGAGTVPEH